MNQNDFIPQQSDDCRSSFVVNANDENEDDDDGDL